MTIYAVEVTDNKTGEKKISQAAYTRLYDAQQFIVHRSDVNHADMIGLTCYTDEHTYNIIALYIS